MDSVAQRTAWEQQPMGKQEILPYNESKGASGSSSFFLFQYWVS